MTDSPRQVVWRVSPWDQQAHGFRGLGPNVSEALCRHSVITSQLTEPVKGADPCLICVQIYGAELRERDSDRWWS